MLWLLFAFLSGLSAAVLAIVIKLWLKQIDSFTLAFIFALVMALMFLILGIVLKKFEGLALLSMTRKEWIFVALAGIINAFAFMCYITALQCGKACNVIAIDRLSIVFVLILSMFILRESFSYISIFGAFLMVVGAWFMAM
jgi:transporter family protein